MPVSKEEQIRLRIVQGLTIGLADTFTDKLKTFRSLEEASILFEEESEQILYAKMDKLLDKETKWTERELLILSSIFFILAAGEEE